MTRTVGPRPCHDIDVAVRLSRQRRAARKRPDPMALDAASRLQYSRRMRSRAGIAMAAALGAGLAGCGSDGGAPSPDGGPGADAGLPYCAMRVSLESEMPRAPSALEVGAEITTASLSGLQTYAWQVRFEDGLVPHTSLDPDERRISFVAEEPGLYRVLLEGSVDGVPCTDADEPITVAPADAMDRTYRLRFVPRPGQAAVVHERTDTIAAGLDYDMGRITLPTGVTVGGAVRSPDGAPLAAYVRALRSGAAPVEAFAGADGQFSMRLENAAYDVLVVPVDHAFAPARFLDQPSAPAWPLSLPATDQVTGAVLDPAGDPVPGARVSLRTGSAPATVAVTDESGAFSVPARHGETAALTVVPPAESGLPWLELPPSPELGAALGQDGALTVAYAAGPGAREIAPVARDAGGAALGNVRATWVARAMPDAGALTAGEQPPLALTGTTRVAVTAGPDGAWPAARLPGAVYDVILEPPPGAGAVTVREVDLTAGEPVDSLALAEPAIARGAVVDSAAAALPGVQVTAVPRGLLAHSPDAGASAVTGEDGFALALSPGGVYELVFDSLDRRHGRVRVPVPALTAGEITELTATALPPAARLSGEVALLDGGAAAGVTVLLLCFGCDDPTPVAEAVSDSTGAFVLAVPH